MRITTHNCIAPVIVAVTPTRGQLENYKNKYKLDVVIVAKSQTAGTSVKEGSQETKRVPTANRVPQNCLILCFEDVNYSMEQACANEAC